ncbi:MAG TPA: ParA family protein [Kribbella sp.]
MADTYAVVTLSGSVAKTTSVTCFGVLLAQAGHRVRVYDLDAQSNASSWLGYTNPQGKTIYDVLQEQATPTEVELPARFVAGSRTVNGVEEEVYETIPNLTVIPSSRGTLDKIAIELPAMTDGVARLLYAIQEDESAVDINLIDCPGTMNPLVLAGILATADDESDSRRPGSWGVITCTKPSGKENEGIPKLEEQLRMVRRTYRADVPLVAIIPCAVPGSGNLYPEQMKNLKEAYGDIVTPEIRRATVVDKAYTYGVPLPLYGYEAKLVTDDYRRALEYLQARGHLTEKGALTA